VSERERESECICVCLYILVEENSPAMILHLWTIVQTFRGVVLFMCGPCTEFLDPKTQHC